MHSILVDLIIIAILPVILLAFISLFAILLTATQLRVNELLELLLGNLERIGVLLILLLQIGDQKLTLLFVQLIYIELHLILFITTIFFIVFVLLVLLVLLLVISVVIRMASFIFILIFILLLPIVLLLLLEILVGLVVFLGRVLACQVLLLILQLGFIFTARRG